LHAKEWLPADEIFCFQCHGIENLAGQGHGAIVVAESVLPPAIFRLPPRFGISPIDGQAGGKTDKKRQ